MRLSDLTPDSHNARKHNPKNIGLIEQSIRAVGAARSGVVDENGVILAGNGTYEALAAAGIEKVKVVEADGNEWVVVRRTGLTEEQKRVLALADNRSGEIAEWDGETLKAQGIDLAPWFSGAELAALIAPDEISTDYPTAADSAETMSVEITGPVEKFTAQFMDRLSKFLQPNGISIKNDDPSRPKRRMWGSWTPGKVTKPQE